MAGVVSYLVTGWLATGPALLRSLDIPNERSSHTRPTPRIGGLGIVAAFVMLMPLLAVMLLPAARNWEAATKFGIALLGYAIIISVGLVDDLRQIGPLPKYLGQLLAAVIAIWGGVLFLYVELPFLGRVPIATGLGIALTILWLTGFSNFFNFMDGIDGLAGGAGVIYSFFLACICIGTGHRLLGAASLMLTAGCLGFLAHNFPPAKIFMGDVGSLFIGFVLAAFTVWTTSSGTRPAPLPAVLLVFGSFLYDAGFTMLRRLRRGEKLYEAHRSHLYQRLVIAGQSHRRVSLTYYAISTMLGGAGLLYTFAGDLTRLLLLIFGGALLLGFTAYVYWYENHAARTQRMFAETAVRGTEQL